MTRQIKKSETKTTSATDGAGGGKANLTWDEVFDLLSNERRRLALERVARGRGPVDFQDVVDFVFENQSKDPDDTSRKATYVALHQVHIPTLSEKGVVVWDQDDGKIYLGENGALVVDSMSRAVDQDSDAKSFRDRLGDFF